MHKLLNAVVTELSIHKLKELTWINIQVQNLKSLDEWVTTKQACRDKLVTLFVLVFSSTIYRYIDGYI